MHGGWLGAPMLHSYGNELVEETPRGPRSDRQKWYFPVCTAKYNTNLGIMIELATEGERYHLKAAFPTRDIESIKALVVERAHGHGHSNAEELLKQLPEIHPMNKEWLKPTASPSAYSCEKLLFDTLPVLDWDTLYACAA